MRLSWCCYPTSGYRSRNQLYSGFCQCGYKGFRKPCIKFEFASNIVTTASVLTLNLQIFKQCKNQLVPIPVGPVWTFSRLVAVTESNAFTFFVCDCDICEEECCNYSVVATVVGVATVGVTSINNATLSAIVIDNGCGCK